MAKLENEEKEIAASVERREWRSAPRLKRERERYRGYAKGTFDKGRRGPPAGRSRRSSLLE
jgi:hypothetical protein